MTSYFPDINVWVALTIAAHPQSNAARLWWEGVEAGDAIYFSRHSQLGLLRLLCTEQVIADKAFTIKHAWALVDEFCSDLRVQMALEPLALDVSFKRICLQKGAERAPKFLADAYMIAFALVSGFTLVTFDRSMVRAARLHGCAVLRP